MRVAGARSFHLRIALGGPGAVRVGAIRAARIQVSVRNVWWWSRAVLLAALFSSGASAEDAASPIRLDLDASVRYGPIRGFVQIPRGGAPESTTSRKPTLSQMGVTEVTAEDVQLEAGYDGPGIYAGAHFIHLTGGNTLGVPLVSQGTQFAAGAAVRGSLQLDWYRFGAQYAFLGARPDAEFPFSIRPGLGFLLLSQSYELRGAGGERASRSFSTGGPQFLVDAEWIVAGPFSLLARFSSTFPIPKLPWVLTAELRARLRLFGEDADGGGVTFLGSGVQGGFVFVGVAFDRVESNDLQNPVANHIRAAMGPLVVGGIELRY